MRGAARWLAIGSLLIACKGTGTSAPAPSASAGPKTAPATSTSTAATSASATAKAEDWVIRVKRYSLADGFGRTYWFHPSGKVESETLIDGKDSTTIAATSVETFVEGLSQCGLCAPGKKPGDATAGKSQRFVTVEVNVAGGARCAQSLPWESWQVAEKACLSPLRAGMNAVGEDLDAP